MGDFAELLDDQTRLKSALYRLVERAKVTVALNAGSRIASFYATGLCLLIERNCDLVFGRVTSPIERIWINSLQVRFLRDAWMLVITPPISDVGRWRSVISRGIVETECVTERARSSGHSLYEFDTYLENQVASRRLRRKDREACFSWAIEYGVLPFGYAHHLTLQAGFPKNESRERSLRADALIWHPRDPALNVIVECDGYSFHCSKRAFIEDRQRDRFLLREGHVVMRFSGSEIVADPAAAVRDLYGYLWDRSGALRAHDVHSRTGCQRR